MDSEKGKSRFKFVKRISAKRMSKEEYEESERLLARLEARAYAANHSELFGNREDLSSSEEEKAE